jgi:hypothetical protein
MRAIAVAGVMALASATTVAGGATTSPERARPRIEVSGDDVMIDDRVKIVVKGLEPRQRVRLALSMERFDVTWQSEAFFTADRRGRVRVAKAAPTSGDYTGVDPMGLFWSARPPPGGRHHRSR